MALVIFRTRMDQNKSKFKEKIQHYQFDLTFYGICTSCFIFQLSLYELMIAEYLAFHMELQKRGIATIRRSQTQILLFFPIIRSTFLTRKTMLLIYA